MAETRAPSLLIAESVHNERDAAAAAAPIAQTRSPTHRQFVEELFARYREPLLRYLRGLLARRADAEDVLQETYARLLGVDTLDRTPTRARAYVFKIATNLVNDRFRGRVEHSVADVAADSALFGAEESPEGIVDFAQGLEIVRRTLLDLKPRCRQVFLLRAAEDLSYEAIADRLGISKRTVEREMKHALDVCQKRLRRVRT